MSSVSGLSAHHRQQAKARTVQAATLGLHNAARLHYTQDGRRWRGIDAHKVAARGQYPTQADCSSFATWCLWNGLFVPFGVRDTVNGARWARAAKDSVAAARATKVFSTARTGRC